MIKGKNKTHCSSKSNLQDILINFFPCEIRNCPIPYIIYFINWSHEYANCAEYVIGRSWRSFCKEERCIMFSERRTCFHSVCWNDETRFLYSSDSILLMNRLFPKTPRCACFVFTFITQRQMWPKRLKRELVRYAA